MSEVAKNRQTQRAQLRQLQQEQAQRKRDLAAQQRDDLRTVKEHYANAEREINDESAAAVSHINDEAQEVSNYTRTYNRSAKMESPIVVQQNYETRDSDEFYQIQDRGSQISEDTEGYTIEAYSPEYEKDQVRVSIQNNKAVVSGHRKFQNKAEQDNKIVSTNNYQSFREEFPLGTPVASESMTQERSGDYVRVFVPKIGFEQDFSDEES